MRVALVKCADLPEPDHDEGPLLSAFRGAGHDARTLAWDEPGADAGGFDVAFLRATWNYHRAPDAFLAWCEAAARTTRLLNPPEVVRWNIHKGYLAELAAAGVPVVPTEHVARGDAFEDRLVATGWTDVVVKPAVGAGSVGTKRFGRGRLDEARDYLAELTAGRDALVQPYMPSVETSGERSLIWVAGSWTHAVQKHPRFDGQPERIEARERVSDHDRSIAQGALACVCGEVFYARVDLMDGPGGEPRVSELELIEPSLFFGLGPTALERFVRGCEELVPSD